MAEIMGFTLKVRPQAFILGRTKLITAPQGLTLAAALKPLWTIVVHLSTDQIHHQPLL